VRGLEIAGTALDREAFAALAAVAQAPKK